MELSQLVREIESAPDPRASERIARSRSKVLRSISQTQAHRSRRRRVVFALAGTAGVAAAALALVVVTANLLPAESGVPVASPSGQASPSAGESVGGWGSQGFDADPVTEVAELMEFSQAGVIGEVAGYTQGQLSTNDPLGSGAYSPVLLRIDRVEVIAGELTVTDESVFVTLPGTAGPEDYLKRVPLGTPVVAYLNDITSPDGAVGMTLVKGAPADATIYTVTHPSGFAFEFRQGEQNEGPSSSPEKAMLVFPFAGGTVQGMRASQLVPGERIPELSDLQD